MYEVILAGIKPKLAWFLIHRQSGVIVILIWALSALAAFHATTHIQPQYMTAAPTAPEMERHLESLDKRVDSIDQPDGKMDRLQATLEQRFNELAEDRKEQRQHSDDRYKELNDRVSTIWYGLAGVGALLGLGIIRLKPITGLGAEDTKTLAWFANELRNNKSDRTLRGSAED